MSARTRGLHRGTASHKPDCQCPPCKGRRASVEGQIKALANSPMPLMVTDATIAAIELSQNPKAQELSLEVARLSTALATKCSEYNTLQNTLGESHKISQQREKQLKEAEQKLSHFMGRTSAAEAYLKTVSEALDCKDPAKLAEKAQKLQSDLENLRVDECVLRQDRDALAAELHESQADRDRYTALLSQISGKLSDWCEWDELPLAVETLLQRCNQYGDRSDAMGKANTQLQQERDAVVSELREAHAALKLANASIGSLERDKDLLKEGLAAAEKRGELATTHALFEGNLKTIVVGVILSVIFYMIGKWGKL